MGLEEAHVIPSLQKLAGDGADTVDKNINWMDSHYAGICEWDSSASKFGAALSEGQGFIVGDYFTDCGAYQGTGFTFTNVRTLTMNQLILTGCHNTPLTREEVYSTAGQVQQQEQKSLSFFFQS